MHLLGAVVSALFISQTAKRRPASSVCSTSSAKYETMLEWLSNCDGAAVNKVSLRPSEKGGGYGAFVEEDVEADELLVSIPRSACITMDNALADSKLGRSFKELVEKAGQGGATVALAGYLASQRINSESFYQPYLDTLPWERFVNNQEHILFWNDEDVEELLSGSMCYGEAVDLRKEVELAIRVISSIYVKSEANAFRLPWEAPREAPAPPDKLAASITGAFVCILTRAFQDDNDEEKLVPFLDMLQHSDIPNISHVMKKDTGAVEVRAKVDLKAGTEMLNQYRSELEESMPYNRFFTRFGFVPGIGDDPIIDLLKDKSSIFFAQVAEV